MSKTEHGKFFIVVFQRYIQPKRASSSIDIDADNNFQTGLFDDIKVKELWQMQAIQLLKLYENQLSRFIDSVVVYNSRYERVEFGPLHKQMLDMGELSSRQLKEGMQLF